MLLKEVEEPLTSPRMGFVTEENAIPAGPFPTISPPTHASAALKSVVLMTLFILTFIFGFLPFLLRKAATQSSPETRRRRFALIFGFLSCFGGGIFLATCLLDLLPHAHEEITKALTEMNLLTPGAHIFPIGEFLIAVGFFLVLFLEQIVLWWKESSIKHALTSTGVPPAYESTEDLIESVNADESHHNIEPRLPALLGSINTDPISESNRFNRRTISEERPEDMGSNFDIHFDPEAHSTFRAVVLVFALSLHAIFEGLALGLQEDVSSTLQIFGALCIHKSVLAFSLGLRLVQSKLRSAIIALLCVIFSIMAPIGGFIGVGVIQLAQTKYSNLASGALQGIACGTFLYVTAFEILPHELIEPGHRLWKLLMLVLGFATICVFLLLYPSD